MMSNYKQYFAIEKQLKKQGNHLTRAEMIEDFTKGKKSSLKDLTDGEYKELIIQLNRVIGMTKANPKNDWMNSPENKMRRKVWGLFIRKMHYTEEGFRLWLKKYGKFHKALNEHSREELTQLVTQAKSVYASFLKEVNK
jgi:hypothetical protein